MVKRRGPDDEGLWCDGSAAFGFRRLAVIDTSTDGHQPMVSVDGRYVLVFNGEVYNFRELGSELASHGARFRSSSDTEVVLHALIRWGDAALERLNGMFALGFYDAHEQRLLAARDPMGIKPLYYLRAPEAFVFASQYDQIMRHPLAEGRGIDGDALQLYLRLGYVPPPWAMLEGTGMLRPGHFISMRAGDEVVQRPFYRLPDPPDRRLDFAAAVDRAEDVIRQAVRRQLVSDVPLGVLLSGGVDSPLVAALAQQESGERLSAFTIAGDDPALDESAEAAAIAEAVGLDHVVRRATVTDAEELVARHAAAFGEPFADHSSIPTLLVSEMARERLTVALSGDGGDELFFGYPRFRKVLRVESSFRWPRVLRMGRYGAGRFGVLPSVPAGVRFRDVGAWYLNSHSYWSQPQLVKGAPGLARLPTDFTLYDVPSNIRGDEVADWLRANEVVGHLQRVLLKVDRASMFHSLEVRVPLLDLEVVRFAMQVSPAASMNELGDKAVLRALLRKHVPAEIVSKPKRGFTLPIGDWLRGPLRPMLHDLVLSGRAELSGAFATSALRRLFDEHLAGRDRTLPLWAALMFQVWWRRYYGQR